jgi:hypothetical protein
VLYVAQQQSSRAEGVRDGVWATLALAVVGLVGSLVIPIVSGARPHPPDLEAWLENDDHGLVSPTVAVHLRPGVEDEKAHDLLPRWLRRRP